VHLDRVGRDVLVPRGHGAGDLVLADHRVDVGEEVLHDRVLALRQLQRPAVDGGALLREVDRERAVLDDARALRAAAARERGNPRHQLLGRERLGEVVVGAGVEAMHAVGHRLARRQHQHRLLFAARAQALQPREAIDARKADIEDHEVHIGDAQRRIGALCRGHVVRDITLAAQRLREAVGEDGIVFDDEDSHAQNHTATRLCRWQASRQLPGG